MQKRIFLLMAILVGITCSTVFYRMYGGKNQTRVPIKPKIQTSKVLKAYFPQKEGTIWFYEGFAEYMHKMELRSITKSPKYLIDYYNISGEIADLSDGESKFDFKFRIQYLFTPNSVYERVVKADRPFPHRIKYLRMMALPLKKGRIWRQRVMVDAKPVMLVGEIIKVGQDKIFNKLIDTVTIRYRVPMKNMPNGMYEEIRVFAKGLGVYSFENTFGPNEGERFGYSLRKIETAKTNDNRNMEIIKMNSNKK